MATVDPSIPLSVKTYADYTRDRAAELQVQALQDEATQRKLSLQQQQSLREAFTGADTSTSQGQNDLIKKIQGIDPNTAIKLQKEFVEQGKTKAQTYKTEADTEHSRIQTAIEKNDLIGRSAMSVKDVYQGARKAGKSEQEAIQAGSKERIRAMTNLFQQGVINEDQLKQFIVTPFDPNQLDPIINNTMNVKDQLTQRLNQAKFEQQKKDEDARRQETARHDKAEEGLAGGRLAVERGRLAMQQEEMQGAKLTPDALDQAASIYAKTGNLPTNLGRGKQGAETISKIVNRAAELTKGKSADEIVAQRQEAKADQRTRTELGAREGKIAPRVQEAKSFAEIALKASESVDRSTIRGLNSLLQKGQQQIGDPKLRAFQAANNSLINAYAAAIGGGTSTVSDKDHAREMLTTADNPEAYRAVVNQLITEMDAALAAPKQVMEKMRPGSKEGESTGQNKVVDFSSLK